MRLAAHKSCAGASACAQQHRTPLISSEPQVCRKPPAFRASAQQHRTSRQGSLAPAAFLRSLLQRRERNLEEEAATSASNTLLSRPPADCGPQTAPPAPLLSGSGGGIFFFHQLGVVQYLEQRYDLTDGRLAFLGASAGSLLVVLAACGVPAKDALAGAHRLALEHGIFDRPLGVAGIWGGLIRRWLDDLLPDDALERCAGGRVKLVVTEVPSFKQVYLEDFASRSDLLDAALASAHVPFLLDWRPWSAAAGRRFVDGSFQDFIQWRNSDLLTCNGAAFVIDYSQDEKLQTERLDFVKLKQYQEVEELMNLGYAFAGRLDAAGRLEPHFGLVRRKEPSPL